MTDSDHTTVEWTVIRYPPMRDDATAPPLLLRRLGAESVILMLMIIMTTWQTTLVSLIFSRLPFKRQELL